jgi:hypothetical protein
VSRAFFEQVVETLVGFLPPEQSRFSSRITGRNAKVWFGAEAKEHYEAQLVRRDGATVLEIGFHAEHSSPERSDAVLQRILTGERRWRRTLGKEVETGPFLGRPSPWRRASETWPDIDLDDPGTAVDAADRLAAYITALEPLRLAARQSGAR